MQKIPLSDWDPNFIDRSPLFEPLGPLAALFSRFEHWPGLADYQRILAAWPHPIKTLGGMPLKIVAQDGKPPSFEHHYAPRIYLTGEIQTRTENWHDFFQYLSWFMFPNTKALINATHIPHARNRIAGGGALGRRTPIENMLSLFDEGGAVIVSSDPSLLALIRAFRWKELLWQRRDDVMHRLQCITFGHAMYEKALSPYLGMTANAILLECEEDFLGLDWPAKWAWLDDRLVAMLRDSTHLTQPKDLAPFPILGMPGWDAANESEAFYDNTRYFRPGRRIQCREG
ncbi:MAG: DUF3025 domain-containing protein [Pseudomonadota bacterium]